MMTMMQIGLLFLGALLPVGNTQSWWSDPTTYPSTEGGSMWLAGKWWGEARISELVQNAQGTAEKIQLNQENYAAQIFRLNRESVRILTPLPIEGLVTVQITQDPANNPHPSVTGLPEVNAQGIIKRPAPLLHSGDVVPISDIRIEDNAIFLDIAGGKSHGRKISTGQGGTIDATQKKGGGGCTLVISFETEEALRSLSPEKTTGQIMEILEITHLLAFVRNSSNNTDPIQRFPSHLQEFIRNGEVKPGMTREMVYTALGPPNKVRRYAEQDSFGRKIWRVYYIYTDRRLTVVMDEEEKTVQGTSAS